MSWGSHWTVAQAALGCWLLLQPTPLATAGPGCLPYTQSMLLGYLAISICGFPAFCFYDFFELVYYFPPYFGLYLHLSFRLSAWRVKELFPVTFSCTVCNFSSKFPYHAFNCLFHTRFSLLSLQNILKAFSYDFFFHLWIICVFYCPNIWTILYLFFCN